MASRVLRHSFTRYDEARHELPAVRHAKELGVSDVYAAGETSPPRFGRVATPEALADSAATLIVHALRDRLPEDLDAHPEAFFTLGTATGSTPLGTYRALAAMAGRDAWVATAFAEHVRTVGLDEYVGSGDYAEYMTENVWNPLHIPEQHRLLPNGRAEDPEAEAARFETLAGGDWRPDLWLCGIGPEGHLGFNERGSPHDGPTAVVSLAQSTLDANAVHHGGDAKSVPRQAITAGLGTISGAGAILVLANTEAKGDAVADILAGRSDTDCPGRILWAHANATVLATDAVYQRGRQGRFPGQRMPAERGSLGHQFLTRENPGVDVNLFTVAGHSDDGALSAGGLGAELRKTGGKHVIATVLTGHRAVIEGTREGPAGIEDRTSIRQREAAEESHVLGAESVWMARPMYERPGYAFDDADVDAMIASMKAALPGDGPAVVCIPPPEDAHQAHRRSGELALHALKRWAESDTPPVTLPDLLVAQSPWAQAGTADAYNLVVTLEPDAVRAKLDAVEAHVSQTARTPYPEWAQATGTAQGIVDGELRAGHGKKGVPKPVERFLRVALTPAKLDTWIARFEAATAGPRAPEA